MSDYGAQPKAALDPCVFCESFGDTGNEHSHADFLNHFESYEAWGAHPSLIIAQTLAERSADGGFYDEDDGAYDQEQAMSIIAALEKAGWSFVPPSANPQNNTTGGTG